MGKACNESIILTARAKGNGGILLDASPRWDKRCLRSVKTLTVSENRHSHEENKDQFLRAQTIRKVITQGSHHLSARILMSKYMK